MGAFLCRIGLHSWAKVPTVWLRGFGFRACNRDCGATKRCCG